MLSKRYERGSTTVTDLLVVEWITRGLAPFKSMALHCEMVW
jgi:hypothetical protein